MNTEILAATEENIKKAASVLKSGNLVAIPTETVYGLAANALDSEAIKKIFIAKGRPQDNPLIVHINSIGMLNSLTVNVPKLAYDLAYSFWPGPLTMVLQKANHIPLEVTAGLDTIGIRFPENKVALSVISESNLPLAAPSANISGSPSPTKASHVFSDLNGKIPLVIDGGESSVGLESTVISVKENSIKLLRPGAVTVDDLKRFADVEIDKGVLNELDLAEKVSSPGMKYKHYSPKAKIIILESNAENFADFVNSHNEKGVYAMTFDGEEKSLNVPVISFGNLKDSSSQAKILFDNLRKCDELNAKIVYVRSPKKDGIGLAVYNRLLRAAAFTIIKL